MLDGQDDEASDSSSSDASSDSSLISVREFEELSKQMEKTGTFIEISFCWDIENLVYEYIQIKISDKEQTSQGSAESVNLPSMWICSIAHTCFCKVMMF